ncbi:Transposase IS116/IS110/IS902 family protein [Paramaledivibacter caminithermalis DSM 15212]|uniref:Transposase IS116/IS110/IS902 family protein n=1 Tax=Paramaledivibacter caminithermalis (strain DSM 15212 / CIP 107654 / DViRD3) TaxID=1121301 RepID=A0A1M6RIH7_PARC5|nr:Transposase IS116/IS110/IS902 family protein [Paramaledivibacter caminithermalis DSM 15212]
MKLYVGIDVSSFDLKVCFMDGDGNILKRSTNPNNPSSTDAIAKEILSLTHNVTSPIIQIGMESTSVYSWHPAIYLSQDPSLKELEAKIYTINPKLIKDFKEAYPDLDKTDTVDAFIIADRLRFGRLTFSAIQTEQVIALQRLSRMRFHLAYNLTREKQYFLQNLFFKCSAFKQEVDSSVFGNAILELLLERFTLDEISSMDTFDLATYLSTKGKNHFDDPEGVAKCIQKAARSSYRLSKCVEDSINILLATSIESIRSITRQIKELDKSIARLMDGIPNTLQSIPGIGPVYSAGILAEIGDIHRFKNEASVAKYAGLTWPKRQSGT